MVFKMAVSNVMAGNSYLSNLKNQLMSLGYSAAGWKYLVGEHHMYGSSRTGVHQTNLQLSSRFMNYSIQYVSLANSEYVDFYRGKRNYELSNHLGNVQVVVSDRRISVCDGSLNIERNADVVSAVDYYPFGMVMPDRQWYVNADSSGYRFGFNGQEKDNEVSGVGNSYSAEYWQYDSKLGRRSNIDPITKIFQSPYVAFRNSPLFYTDPFGDDDIFDQKGKFLGKIGDGNEIRVLNKDITFEQAQKNPTTSTTLLTDLTYFPADIVNRQILSAVATYYGAQAGIGSDEVIKAGSAKGVNEGVAAYYSTDQDDFFIHVTKAGKINFHLANINNLVTVLVHEKIHQDNHETFTPLNHVNAIIGQSQHASFAGTTSDFKGSHGAYAAKLLNEALAVGTELVNVKKKMEEFNASPVGNYSKLTYNEETKQVEFEFYPFGGANEED